MRPRQAGLRRMGGELEGGSVEERRNGYHSHHQHPAHLGHCTRERPLILSTNVIVFVDFMIAITFDLGGRFYFQRSRINTLNCHPCGDCGHQRHATLDCRPTSAPRDRRERNSVKQHIYHHHHLRMSVVTSRPTSKPPNEVRVNTRFLV
ncbi:hypothetical protein BC936DRAFT_142835 [Jimgerdemannia flammicorona]|uniref:Uncharacterized protein n=1 Tax=Jimgerdemannia flammicorona TaxID=994334 RepID=A0A432ZZU4_9FUNG|nr:hypothetical protein BC936DRAFT_142835 [Jimgerdemannia flammicorona]